MDHGEPQLTLIPPTSVILVACLPELGHGAAEKSLRWQVWRHDPATVAAGAATVPSALAGVRCDLPHVRVVDDPPRIGDAPDLIGELRDRD